VCHSKIIFRITSKASLFHPQGLNDTLCQACEELKWKAPSKIQREAIPVALQGKDVIGLAETGSGKTGAFALPILHALLENPQRYFALVLTPTRELAFQIGEQFEALGKSTSNLVYLIITKPHNDVKPVLILFSNENVKLLFLYSSLPLS